MKIKNVTSRALHVNGRHLAVMPGEEVEVEKLPDNKDQWKIVSNETTVVVGKKKHEVKN